MHGLSRSNTHPHRGGKQAGEWFSFSPLPLGDDRDEETRRLPANCFLRPGFLEPEEPRKEGLQTRNVQGRCREKVLGGALINYPPSERAVGFPNKVAAPKV